MVALKCCLLIEVTLVHNKFASLRQVNSRNSQIIQVSNMLYQQVFGTFSSEFCGTLHVFLELYGILQIYLKFTALQPCKKSEALYPELSYLKFPHVSN